MINPPQGVIVYAARSYQDQIQAGTVTKVIRPGDWRWSVGRRLIISSESKYWSEFAGIVSVEVKKMGQLTESDATDTGLDLATLRSSLRCSSPELSDDDDVTVMEFELDG